MVYKIIKEVLIAVQELIYPRYLKCIHCRSEKSINKYGLCNMCYNEIEFVQNPCSKCGKSLDESYAYDMCLDCMDGDREFRKGFSLFTYEGIIKKLIISYKYGNKGYLNYYLSKMISDIELIDFDEYDAIVIVPSTGAKINHRGFDHIHLIAKKMSSIKEVLYIDDLVLKVKDTVAQNELTRKERIINLKSAFEVNHKYKNTELTKLLLLDDIFTTGTTINEVTKTIKSNFECEVDFLTIATGIQ